MTDGDIIKNRTQLHSNPQYEKVMNINKRPTSNVHGENDTDNRKTTG